MSNRTANRVVRALAARPKGLQSSRASFDGGLLARLSGSFAIRFLRGRA
jgi:hypothetical protein